MILRAHLPPRHPTPSLYNLALPPYHKLDRTQAPHPYRIPFNMRSQIYQILFLLIGALELVNAQSMGPSNTLRRRDPLPTDVDQLRLHLEQESQSRSRSRSRSKIIGMGHEADDLPFSNAERMRLGLPLKPPTRQESIKEQTVHGNGDGEVVL